MGCDFTLTVTFPSTKRARNSIRAVDEMKGTFTSPFGSTCAGSDDQPAAGRTLLTAIAPERVSMTTEPAVPT